ncbi:MAG: AzlC family ABC transporter permease [Candidatus Rokubacteria bacterium]|nr:AzlC family ABC transporter permease [Candidatus Rokubacteria bacterium]
MTPGREFVAGFREALPVAVGVVVYGAVWGALAVQVGLPLGAVVLMCLVVSAGASQFVAVPMIAAGSASWTIAATTFLVNLRHALMAASLAPRLRHVPMRWLAFLAHGINDESFALTTARYVGRPISAAYFVGSVAAVYGGWYLGAVTGAISGTRLPNPYRFGLDFTFPAVFLALVVPQLRDRWGWSIAGVAAPLALLGAWLLPGKWYIILAALGASALGAAMRRDRG